MKKRNFLMVLMPLVLVLASCGATPAPTPSKPRSIVDVQKIENEDGSTTYTVTYSDETAETFTIEEEPVDEGPVFDSSNKTITRDALKDIQGRLVLDGALTVFAGDETAKGSDTTIDVTFTEDAWFYSSVDDLGQENTGNIFKIGDKAVIAGINLQNELVFSEMTDDEGNVQDFEQYTNPFKDLTIYDFEAVEGEEGVFSLRMDLPSVEEKAIEIVGVLTNYIFPELSSFEVKTVGGQITTIMFETPKFETYFGFERYVGNLEIVERGAEVGDLKFPEPLPTLEGHETLLAALEEINTENLKAKYVQVDKYDSSQTWEEAESSLDFDCYFTKDTFLLKDNLDPRYTAGATVIDGQAYEIGYDEASGDYTRAFYPVTDENGSSITDLTNTRGNFLIAAPEHFSIIDDKHFEITGVYAGTVAYYFDLAQNAFSASMTKVSIELDDNNKIKTIEFTDEMFSKVTMTFEQIGGTVEMPFNLDELVVEEDPFLALVHTYKYTDESGTEHNIVVTSQSDIKVDGVAATNISFDKLDTITFEAGDHTYEIRFMSYSKYYTLTIEGPGDFYEYYSSAAYDGSLTVE